MADTRTIGGIGVLYQSNVQEEPEEDVAPKNLRQHPARNGDELAGQAASAPQAWAAAASLLGSVYYNFFKDTDPCLPSGTLVPLGKDVPLVLEITCYYLQLEDGRVFWVELQRNQQQGPTPYIFLARRQANSP